MAKPSQSPDDPFRGLSSSQVDTIKSYFDNMMADERKAMDAVLSDATKPAEPASVAAAAGLDVAEPSASNLMVAISAMYSSASEFIAECERQARSASQAANQKSHTDFSRLATIFGEFRNGLATVLPSPGSLPEG